VTARRVRSSAPKSDNTYYYSGMLQTIEEFVDHALLAELFARIREAGLDASLPVNSDPAVHRMFVRVGLIPPNSEAPVATKLVEEFIRLLSEDLSRTPAQISLLLRLFSCGMYGVMAEAVCGATPRCSVCQITRKCEYFSKTPLTAAESKLPSFKRFLRGGEDLVSDAELLALIIGGSKPSTACTLIAEALITKFGSLRSLVNSSCSEMTRLEGVTETIAVKIAAACALHRKVAEESRLRKPAVRSGKDFFDLYHHKLRDRKKESFFVVLLDVQNHIMKDEEVSVGSLAEASVYPREVFSTPVREAAYAVAFVHNHPTGDSKPSEPDKTLTKRLVECGTLLGIPVIDHVIIGDGCYTSFFDEGLI